MKRQYPVALPYIKGLSEELQRIFRSHGVSTYHKPFNTLRSLLVKPKDKPVKEKKCGTIYSVSCENCQKEYVGESGRTLGIRFKGEVVAAPAAAAAAMAVAVRAVTALGATTAVTQALATV